MGTGRGADTLSRERVRTGPLIALVAVMAIVPFWNVPGHRFLTWDDNIIILAQPFLRHVTLENVLTALSPVPAREEWLPLRDLTLMLNFAASGDDPFGFAVVNVLLHAAASVAVFFLLWRLAENRAAAALGALLFACHAVHVESVTWLSGRKDPLSAVFLVSALLAHIRWRSGEGRYATVPVLLALALLSKASAFVFPLWALAYDAFYRRDLTWRQRFLPIVPYAAVAFAGIAVFLRLISKDGVIEEYPPGGLATVLLTNVVLLKDYALQGILPLRHQAIYDVRFVTSPADLELLASALFLSALAGVAWRFRRAPWVPFGVVFFFGTFFPYLNIVPHGIYYAERYLYLPTIAIALWAGIACSRALESRTLPDAWRRAVVPVFSTILALHVLLLTSRNEVWADSETFWSYQASRLPDRPAPLMNLGETRELAGDDAAAAKTYGRVLERFGGVPEALFRLARIARRQGNLDAARSMYEEHVRLAPQDPRPLNNLGEVLLAQGRPALAIAAFENAVLRHPRYLLARANLAQALESEGRADEAAAHWRFIVEHAELLPELDLVREAKARLTANRSR